MRAILLPLFTAPLLAAGCLVVATQPPEAGKDPSVTPPTAEPTSTAVATATPTAQPTVTPTAEPTAEPTSSASPASGQLCGSRGLAPCASGQFCNFPAGSECGATDRGGVCQAIPQACTREYKPVCGCDGQTYPNACTANSKGVSVSKEGKCN